VLGMSYRGKPRETNYAKFEREFFKQNPVMTKVIIPKRPGDPQDEVILAKIISGNLNSGEIIARIADEPFEFNRDRFSEGDLVLAENKNRREWPCVVQKL
jgi:hypothetical protein